MLMAYKKVTAYLPKGPHGTEEPRHQSQQTQTFFKSILTAERQTSQSSTRDYRVSVHSLPLWRGFFLPFNVHTTQIVNKQEHTVKSCLFTQYFLLHCFSGGMQCYSSSLMSQVRFLTPHHCSFPTFLTASVRQWQVAFKKKRPCSKRTTLVRVNQDPSQSLLPSHITDLYFKCVWLL